MYIDSTTNKTIAGTCKDYEYFPAEQEWIGGPEGGWQISPPMHECHKQTNWRFKMIKCQKCKAAEFYANQRKK